MHYSPVSYWTPGWIYPRSKIREPFPRRRRQLSPAVFGGTVPQASYRTVRLVLESWSQSGMSGETFAVSGISGESAAASTISGEAFIL